MTHPVCTCLFMHPCVHSAFRRVRMHPTLDALSLHPRTILMHFVRTGCIDAPCAHPPGPFGRRLRSARLSGFAGGRAPRRTLIGVKAMRAAGPGRGYKSAAAGAARGPGAGGREPGERRGARGGARSITQIGPAVRWTGSTNSSRAPRTVRRAVRIVLRYLPRYEKGSSVIVCAHNCVLPQMRVLWCVLFGSSAFSVRSLCKDFMLCAQTRSAQT